MAVTKARVVFPVPADPEKWTGNPALNTLSPLK
jgi:hypothetical protein